MEYCSNSVSSGLNNLSHTAQRYFFLIIKAKRGFISSKERMYVYKSKCSDDSFIQNLAKTAKAKGLKFLKVAFLYNVNTNSEIHPLKLGLIICTKLHHFRSENPENRYGSHAYQEAIICTQ